MPCTPNQVEKFRNHSGEAADLTAVLDDVAVGRWAVAEQRRGQCLLGGAHLWQVRARSPPVHGSCASTVGTSSGSASRTTGAVLPRCLGCHGVHPRRPRSPGQRHLDVGQGSPADEHPASRPQLVAPRDAGPEKVAVDPTAGCQHQAQPILACLGPEAPELRRQLGAAAGEHAERAVASRRTAATPTSSSSVPLPCRDSASSTSTTSGPASAASASLTAGPSSAAEGTEHPRLTDEPAHRRWSRGEDQHGATARQQGPPHGEQAWWTGRCRRDRPPRRPARRRRGRPRGNHRRRHRPRSAPRAGRTRCAAAAAASEPDVTDLGSAATRSARRSRGTDLARARARSAMVASAATCP